MAITPIAPTPPTPAPMAMTNEQGLAQLKQENANLAATGYGNPANAPKATSQLFTQSALPAGFAQDTSGHIYSTKAPAVMSSKIADEQTATNLGLMQTFQQQAQAQAQQSMLNGTNALAKLNADKAALQASKDKTAADAASSTGGIYGDATSTETGMSREDAQAAWDQNGGSATGWTQNADGTWKQPAGTGAPKQGASVSPEEAQIQSEYEQATSSMDADLAKYNSALEAQMASLDERNQAAIRDIQLSFAKQRDATQNLNDRTLATYNKLGIRSGRQRYAAEIQTGIIDDQSKKAIDRITELNSQEQSLIQEAKFAVSDKAFEMLDKQRQAIQQNRQEKNQLIQQLRSNAIENEKLGIERQKMAATKAKDAVDQDVATSKALAAGALEAMGGVIDDDAVTAYAHAYNLDENVLRSQLVEARTTKEKEGAVGEVGQWMAAKKNGAIDPGMGFEEFKNLGKTPAANTSWQDIDGRRQLVNDLTGAVIKDAGSSSSGASGEDKELSYTEAMALGVPMGTTRSEVRGMIPKKAATEANNNAAGYAVRMNEAGQLIEDLEPLIAKMGGTKFAAEVAAEPSAIGNKFVSDEIRQVRQAERNFVTALLRRESGAAISPSEFATAEKQYFPRPGDDAKTLENKARARQTALSGVVKSAGPAYEEPEPITAKAISKKYAVSQSEVDEALKAGKTPEEINKYFQDTGNYPKASSGLGSGNLGSLSQKFESGGDPGVIGYDSTGGYSYGTYQLAHNNAKKFVDQSPYAGEFKGLTFNSPQWQEKWKQIAKKDPSGFADAQHDFIDQTHFQPQVQKLAAAGVDVNSLSPALQDVIWSTAVQHGANTNVIDRAFKELGKNATDAELIKKIYDLRWDDGRAFASSTPSVKKSVENRFFGKNGELQRALAMASGSRTTA